VPQLPPFCAAVTHPVLSQQPLAHDVPSHATQAPAEQIEPLPHDLPSLMFVGEPHTGPLVQLIVPCWQGLPGGVQIAFGVHALQAPLPSHTPLVTAVAWHEAPAAAGVFWSVHVIVPPAHEVTFPVWQGLLAGEHALPTMHALHTPV